MVGCMQTSTYTTNTACTIVTPLYQLLVRQRGRKKECTLRQLSHHHSQGAVARRSLALAHCESGEGRLGRDAGRRPDHRPPRGEHERPCMSHKSQKTRENSDSTNHVALLIYLATAVGVLAVPLAVLLSILC